MSQPQTNKKGKPRTPLADRKSVVDDDATTTAATDELGKGEMRPEDVTFLMDCLQNTVGGQIQIDCIAVAKKRNQINSRSIANRISQMKKKYGMPITATAAKKTGGKGGERAGEKAGAALKKVKGAARVTKPAARKATAKSTVKKEESGGEASHESSDESPDEQTSDEQMGDGRQSPANTEELERSVFGEPDEVEEDITRKEGFEHETDNDSDAV